MLRLPLRYRRPLIAVTLLIGAIIGGYLWHHRIPDVTSALGPPPKVFHDPRLDTPLTITFNGVKFVDAVQAVADRVHVPITVDASLVPDIGLDDYPVYFHAHQLPARLIVEHLAQQVDYGEKRYYVENTDGLEIVPFEKTIAHWTVHTIDLASIIQLLDSRYPSQSSIWSRLKNWANEKLHWKTMPVGPWGPDVEKEKALAEMLMQVLPHLDQWEPISSPGWTTHCSPGSLTVTASADQQSRIYQLATEIYLGLCYGSDSRQLHPMTEQRRRALAWLASREPTWKQPEHWKSQWLKQAERDAVSMGIFTNEVMLAAAGGEQVVWLVDEHGVVIAGGTDTPRDFRVTRTYDLGDLIKAGNHAGGTPRIDQLLALADEIEKHVVPNGWAPPGLTAVSYTMDSIFIVSAPLETHDQVAAYLTKLREAKK